MKTEAIMAGIWSATSERELTLHMDNVTTAIDMGECSYDFDQWSDIRLAVKEVIANNFKRLLH